MHDTSPAMDEKMRELRAKTPLERAKMGCSMYETSRYLVRRAIMENNPSISENDLRKELFLKFYKNDFSPEKAEQIAEYLQNFQKKHCEI